MSLFIIISVAFASAILTFFCGFGLGTIMLPVFALFFPVEIAVAATAIVHLSNNLFKLLLVGKNIHFKTLMYFGLTAGIASIAGAWLFSKLIENPTQYTIEAFNMTFIVESPKLVVAILITIFSVLEINKSLNNISLPIKLMPIGGILSGFFGGLSGHQGALRSIFLLKAGLSKEQFVATRSSQLYYCRYP
jgi:uncharacterized protein